jgi:hypothetical protein
MTSHSFWPDRTTLGGLSTMGNDSKVATGVEQSSKERGRTGEGKKWSGQRCNTHIFQE